MRYMLYVVLITFAFSGCKGKESAQQASQSSENSAAVTKPVPPSEAEIRKIVADKCERCHGMDGVLASMGAPFIAGLDQGYLSGAMQAYADGSRRNDDMKAVVEEFKDKPEHLAGVVAFYATLKTPWKGANTGMGKPAAAPSPASIKAGATLAARCNHCHGEKGSTTKNDATPRLAGMPPEYFIPSLKSYFNGKRHNEVMKIFDKSLNDQQISQLAAYYAAQPPVKLNRPGSGNVKAGEQAAGMCAGCHSVDGNALNPEMPSLAGQPAEYLIKAMKDYRDGHRGDPMMAEALRKMQDQAIADLAAYYASQKLESPLQRASQSAMTFDPVAEGRRIAGSCNGCHGRNGNSEKAGVPSLTGLHVKYLAAATRAYRDGARKHDVMKKMVGRLSDIDIEKVSFYYATQEPTARKQPSKADLAAGEKLSAGCTGCHGAGGVSTGVLTPSLAGQDAGYLDAAMRDYASEARSGSSMVGPAKGLKPEEITHVAAYFASLKAAKPETKLPDTPQYTIVEKCNRCHGELSKGAEAAAPKINGQSEAYIALAIKEYQDGTRKNKPMHAMVDVLSLVEIKAIASYYARQ